MRPLHATELAAAAAAALQQLESYRSLLEQLIVSPEDALIYRRNSDAFDAMRGLTASLPQVRACWVEVLISRFELMDAVARQDGHGQLARLQERHLQTLECFRRLCSHYIDDSLEARPPVEPPRPDLRSDLLQLAQRHVTDGERHVKQQRELVLRLEASGADASAAHKVLATMQELLNVMYRDLDLARRRSS